MGRCEGVGGVVRMLGIGKVCWALLGCVGRCGDVRGVVMVYGVL